MSATDDAYYAAKTSRLISPAAPAKNDFAETFVTGDGRNCKLVVRLPVPGPLGNFRPLNPGESGFDYLNALAAFARTGNGGRPYNKVLVPQQTIAVSVPNGISQTQHWYASHLIDLDLDFQRGQVIFQSFPTRPDDSRYGAYFSGCQRLRISNLTMSYATPCAVLGTIVSDPSGQPTRIRLGGGAQLSAALTYSGALNGANVSKGFPNSAVTLWDPSAANGDGGFPITLADKSQGTQEVYYNYSSKVPTLIDASNVQLPTAVSGLPAGSPVVLRIALYQGNLLTAHNSSDVTCENVTLLNGIGAGFWFDASSSATFPVRGFRLHNCRLQRPDGAPISTASDAYGANNVEGDLVIDDCDFSGNGDDCVNIRTRLTPMTAAGRQTTVSVNGKSTAVTALPHKSTMPWVVGDTVACVGAADLAYRGKYRLLAFDADGKTAYVAAGAKVAADAMLVDLSAGPQRVLIRGSRFSNNRGHALVMKATNFMIVSNECSGQPYPPIVCSADANSFQEGPGAANGVVCWNTLSNVGWRTSDQNIGAISLFGAASSGTKNCTQVPVIRSVNCYGNVIDGCAGPAYFIASASDCSVYDNDLYSLHRAGGADVQIGTTSTRSDIVVTQCPQGVTVKQSNASLGVDRGSVVHSS